jgi:hypothetical protein
MNKLKYLLAVALVVAGGAAFYHYGPYSAKPGTPKSFWYVAYSYSVGATSGTGSITVSAETTYFPIRAAREYIETRALPGSRCAIISWAQISKAQFDENMAPAPAPTQPQAAPSASAAPVAKVAAKKPAQPISSPSPKAK